MSGGHFDYQQYRLHDIAMSIDEEIKSNDSTELNEWGNEIGHHFSNETIEKFEEASFLLKKCEAMVQRIDWLLSGDDGEDSFHRRWQEEVINVFSEE